MTVDKLLKVKEISSQPNNVDGKVVVKRIPLVSPIDTHITLKSAAELNTSSKPKLKVKKRTGNYATGPRALRTRKPPPKRQKYTVSDKVYKKRQEDKSMAILNYEKLSKTIGMFKTNNYQSVENIVKALNKCSEGDHLVIPSCLIRAFDGDLCKAGFMSFLLYMEKKLSSPEYPWFIAKYHEIEVFTGIKRKKIINYMKELREDGLVETKIKGIPGMQHYKLDHNLLIQLCSERTINFKDPLIDLDIVEVN